jgi:hypothetical protein
MSEQHNDDRARTNCRFTSGARERLERAGFFSVGPEEELYLDREIRMGGMPSIAAKASWFFAFPVCSGSEHIDASLLPTHLTPGINDQRRRESGATSVFVRPDYPTDLYIERFGTYAIAFYARVV